MPPTPADPPGLLPYARQVGRVLLDRLPRVKDSPGAWQAEPLSPILPPGFHANPAPRPSTGPRARDSLIFMSRRPRGPVAGGERGFYGHDASGQGVGVGAVESPGSATSSSMRPTCPVWPGGSWPSNPSGSKTHRATDSTDPSRRCERPGREAQLDHVHRVRNPAAIPASACAPGSRSRAQDLGRVRPPAMGAQPRCSSSRRRSVR